MEYAIEFVAGLGGWSWVILGLLLLSLETVVPGVHFVWFGLAGVATGVLTLLVGSAGAEYAAAFPWQLQIIAFALISFVTVYLVRNVFADGNGKTDAPSLNERARQYVGQSTVVVVPISGGRGKIKVGDSLWQAEGPDLAEGARVRITGVNGSVLVVEPA